MNAAFDISDLNNVYFNEEDFDELVKKNDIDLWCAIEDGVLAEICEINKSITYGLDLDGFSFDGYNDSNVCKYYHKFLLTITYHLLH